MIITETMQAYRVAAQLRRCRELVGEVYKPQGVRIWMTSANRNLGGNTPLELILDGHGDLAIREAEKLASL